MAFEYCKSNVYKTSLVSIIRRERGGGGGRWLLYTVTGVTEVYLDYLLKARQSNVFKEATFISSSKGLKGSFGNTSLKVVSSHDLRTKCPNI